MNMIITSLWFSPIIPQAIPLAFLSTFLTYWTTKYNLLRRHKMPDMFSELMATFFANMLPWIIFFWAISYSVFFEDAKVLTKKRADLLDDEAVMGKAYSAIGFAFFCVAMPCRSIINRHLRG